MQPPDPLDKWQSPPFEPTLRDDRLYARGVSDDKGPLLIPILVAEAYADVAGGLPLNVKFLIEGEEESGSPHFEPTVARLQATGSPAISWSRPTAPCGAPTCPR